MKNKKQVGRALGRVPSGLFVVTAKCGDQEDAVLASWVNQSSFNPPTLTVALAKVRPARVLIEGADAFVVNVLGKDSRDLMKHFFKPPSGSIFKGLAVAQGMQDIPVLKDAVSYLECKLVGSAISGDHVVYIGEVVGGKMLKGGEPYFHVRDNGFSY